MMQRRYFWIGACPDLLVIAEDDAAALAVARAYAGGRPAIQATSGPFRDDGGDRILGRGRAQRCDGSATG
jgi:hypothetical protein